MNSNDLIKAGYKEFSVKTSHNYADKVFQKTIKLNTSKLYFINMYYYDQTKYGIYDSKIYMGECQFYRGEEFWFTVQLHYVKSIEEAELFFSDVYNSLKCIPDVHNNSIYD